MKEFALLFRTVNNPTIDFSPAQMQEWMQEWMTWMGGIAAQNKMASGGNRLGIADSKTVMPGNIVTDGPHAEIKEYINGYIIVKTDTVDEAVELAKGCPILKNGGNVEVRPIVVSDNNN